MIIWFLIPISLILLVSYYTYYIAFYSPSHKRNSLDTPMVGAQYEAVAEHIYRAGHGGCYFLPELRKRMLDLVEISPIY